MKIPPKVSEAISSVVLSEPVTTAQGLEAKVDAFDRQLRVPSDAAKLIELYLMELMLRQPKLTRQQAIQAAMQATIESTMAALVPAGDDLYARMRGLVPPISARSIEFRGKPATTEMLRDRLEGTGGDLPYRLKKGAEGEGSDFVRLAALMTGRPLVLAQLGANDAPEVVWSLQPRDPLNERGAHNPLEPPDGVHLSLDELQGLARAHARLTDVPFVYASTEHGAQSRLCPIFENSGFSAKDAIAPIRDQSPAEFSAAVQAIVDADGQPRLARPIADREPELVLPAGIKGDGRSRGSALQSSWTDANFSKLVSMIHAIEPRVRFIGAEGSTGVSLPIDSPQGESIRGAATARDPIPLAGDKFEALLKSGAIERLPKGETLWFEIGGFLNAVGEEPSSRDIPYYRGVVIHHAPNATAKAILNHDNYAPRSLVTNGDPPVSESLFASGLREIAEFEGRLTIVGTLYGKPLEVRVAEGDGVADPVRRPKDMPPERFETFVNKLADRIGQPVRFADLGGVRLAAGGLMDTSRAPIAFAKSVSNAEREAWATALGETESRRRVTYLDGAGREKVIALWQGKGTSADDPIRVVSRHASSFAQDILEHAASMKTDSVWVQVGDGRPEERWLPATIGSPIRLKDWHRGMGHDIREFSAGVDRDRAHPDASVAYLRNNLDTNGVDVLIFAGAGDKEALIRSARAKNGDEATIVVVGKGTANDPVLFSFPPGTELEDMTPWRHGLYSDGNRDQPTFYRLLPDGRLWMMSAREQSSSYWSVNRDTELRSRLVIEAHRALAEGKVLDRLHEVSISSGLGVVTLDVGNGSAQVDEWPSRAARRAARAKDA
jgi:hypothetical protein